MYENRIKHLEEIHRVLDKRIDGLEKTGVFEDVTLEVLKKQRLHLRDETVILKQKQEEYNQEQQRKQEMKASGFEE
jgi:uncharacterized protein YdcH (DUF465 family)